MPEIMPFRGVLYNRKRFSDPSGLFAPPYDAISSEEQAKLYRASRYNIVRLILGKIYPADNSRSNRYTRAAKLLNLWMKKKILVQDGEPSFYVYAHNYTLGGRPRMRAGFIGLLKLGDRTGRAVFLHEKTYKKPKADRLKLIEETKANLCPIFSLFIDTKNEVTRMLKGRIKGRPLYDIRSSGGVRHRIWRLADSRLIDNLKRLMKDKAIFIADGHHRYEVALRYRELSGYNYVMMYFLNLLDKGLVILPTHRLLRNVAGLADDLSVEKMFESRFRAYRVKTKKLLFKRMAGLRRSHCFGLFLPPNRYYLLTRRRAGRDLDVAVLHKDIFRDILKMGARHKARDIFYTHDEKAAIAEVKNGNCSAAFFLNPTKIEDVRRIASRGERMPHKSTYFYPKPLSGLVVNKFGD